MKEDEINFLNQTFGRKSKNKIKKVDSNLVVKYTRVSGGKQLETDSIENQNKSIDDYAKRANLEIVASFGHTHESAKTDDRKEFQRMIDFCQRSKGKISTILVYKMTRFSRSGGKAISLADELRNKYGIHIIAVSEQVDTSHSTGVVMQNMQLIFAAWDNAQRKEITQMGMKSKYEKGEWLSQVPPGYEVIKQNKERKIVINAEGQKIKKAWLWKYNGMSNEEICDRLVKMGVNMYKQKISKIFKNPFYCGLIAHGILDGKVAEGKQEKMVSKEMFFKINEITQSSSRFGVPHKRESEEMPLKVFVRCSECNAGMTGYIVKKKNLHYYKCRTKGCNCNKSAKQLHSLFLKVFSNYSINASLLPAFSYEYERNYYKRNKDLIEKKDKTEKRLKEIERIIEDLDEQLYIKKELTREKYQVLTSKLEKEKEEIVKEKSQFGVSTSNLSEKIVQAGELYLKLPDLWANGSHERKTELQKLIFPEGIIYDKKTDTVLTPKINEAIIEIARYTGDSSIMKEGLNVSSYIKSLFAVKEGFEPSIQFPVCMFSKHVLSASQAPHQPQFSLRDGKCTIFFKLLKLNVKKYFLIILDA